jgi:hypothetical protein
MRSDQIRDNEPVGTADWLRLAAAPAFGVMALLTAFNAQVDMICSSVPDVFPIDGMVTMYLLMTAFHLPPWLRLVFRKPLHKSKQALRTS